MKPLLFTLFAAVSLHAELTTEQQQALLNVYDSFVAANAPAGTS